MDINQRNIQKWDALADDGVASTFPIEPILASIDGFVYNSWLDYGCGEGRLLQALRPCEVTGVETSRKMLNRAVDVIPPGAVLKHITSTLDFDLNGTVYDVVSTIGVLSSVFDSYTRGALVKKLSSSLRQGGRLVLGDFGRSSAERYVSRYREIEGDQSCFETEDGVLIHHFDATELLALGEADNTLALVRTLTQEVFTIHGRLLPGHVVHFKKL